MEEEEGITRMEGITRRTRESPAGMDEEDEEADHVKIEFFLKQMRWFNNSLKIAVFAS